MLSDLISYSKRLFEEVALIKNKVVYPDINGGQCPKIPVDHELIYSLPPRNDVELSVLIPTYNRPVLLKNAIQSVIDQGNPNFEIVIVNDAGSSPPDDVVQALSHSGRAASIVNHRKNLGLGAARNTAALFSHGKWLVALDDDDELDPDGIRSLLQPTKDSSYGFIYGDHRRRYFDDAGMPIEERNVAAGGDLFHLLHYENLIPTGTFIIRRDVFFELQGYRQDFVVHEDYNFHVRAAKFTPFKYVPGPVFVYNCRHTISRLNLDKRLFWFATSMLNHAIFFAYYPGEPALENEQKLGEYEHLQRALNEGATPQLVSELILSWWNIALKSKLIIDNELEMIERLCPSIFDKMRLLYQDLPK